ncbi:NRDE family protein [Microbulbifer sp. ALW1]|uniref:NRDE family protein n=1 Tax=Microbulbifer sp. (strain ALW1) TaxID=1516059 RepID=UPI001359AEA0|nr:NRDE family protein [Microbulbifer sp. ALW1]
MCLLLIAYRQHPHYPLVMLANRDEFYQRPTAPAQPWQEQAITAGRDLEAGGTWLGMAPGGRVAAVTNIREPGTPEPPNAQSRGEIPLAFLSGTASPVDFSTGLEGARYRGFNAVLFDHKVGAALVCAGNRHQPFALTPGVHGISNGAADAPWPKVTRGRESLAALVAELPEQLDSEHFVAPAMALLADTLRAPIAQLPDTGVGRPMELALSSIFVRIEPEDLAGESPISLAGGYGTRASTLVAVHRDGSTHLWEQTYVDGQASGRLRHFSYPPT